MCTEKELVLYGLRSDDVCCVTRFQWNVMPQQEKVHLKDCTMEMLSSVSSAPGLALLSTISSPAITMCS